MQPSFGKIVTRRAFEEVCAQIRRQVESGKLRAGDKLPPERELAEQFQIGRSTVREALRALEIGGLVSLTKGAKGGATIRQGDGQPITQSMRDLLLFGRLTLREFTEARVGVQREIIRLACERATEADFQALEANIVRLSDVLTPERNEDRADVTIAFYALLARATRNEAFSVLMSALTEPLRLYMARFGPDLTWDIPASRRKFLRHLRERDADAAVAEMEAHMQRLHRYWLSRLETEGG